MIPSDDRRSDICGKYDTIYLASDSFQDLKDAMLSIPNIKVCTGHLKAALENRNHRSAADIMDKKFHEMIRVEYDPEKISLDAILFAFFRIIGLQMMTQPRCAKAPTYHVNIYYENERLREDIERVCKIEKERHKAIDIKIEYLPSAYQKNDSDCPGSASVENRSSDTKNHVIPKMIVDPADYRKPSNEDLIHKLTAEQYSITQEGMTERPFSNECNKRKEKGIYVDVVTGEPLFSSKAKFDTSCGWPGFSSTIDENTILMLNDDSYGMHRVEVRSRAGNSHLGHVFHNDPESPNGTRFCINGASLRFIPFDSMEKEGYGYLMSIF